MKNLLKLIWANAFFIILIITSCSHLEMPVYENELDPLSSTFRQPKATLNYIQDNITQTTINFSWTNYNGFNTINNSFSYMLKNYDTAYSEWTQVNEKTYKYLDEGNYTFFVKEKIGDTEQEIPDSANFIVNAIQQNGIILKPYSLNVVKDSLVFVDLWIEDVINFKGLKAKLMLAPNISIISIEKNEEALSQGATDIILLHDLINEFNESRKGVINILLLGTINRGFTGSSPVCRIYFKAKAEGNIYFEENTAEIRDYINNQTYNVETRGTYINIINSK